MSSEGYHEPVEELSDETRDMHKAIVSLMEELEAVDWYNQRADACKDPRCGFNSARSNGRFTPFNARLIQTRSFR